jgi:hypothetical protein
MIIVSGRIYVTPHKRVEFIKRSLTAVYAARKTEAAPTSSLPPIRSTLTASTSTRNGRTRRR